MSTRARAERRPAGAAPHPADAPIAEPARRPEVVPDLPKWLAAIHYAAATNTTIMVAKVPRAAFGHPGGGTFPLSLAMSPTALRAVIAGLQRCLDESERIVVDSTAAPAGPPDEGDVIDVTEAAPA
jgi:hypothetical protein